MTRKPRGTRTAPALTAALNAMTRAQHHIAEGNPDKAWNALYRGKNTVARHRRKRALAGK